MNLKAASQLIYDCSEYAQRLIDELHERDPQNDTFTQVGLLDGQQIVTEYLVHNEVGIALEHLLYIIHESDIKFDHDQVVHLRGLAQQFNIRNYEPRP